MLVINRAGTCEHQLSHGFSIKLRQEQLTEDTHVKSQWPKQKSFAQLRKGQENLRKSEGPGNMKRERKRIKMATVHLEILNPNQFGLRPSAGILQVWVPLRAVSGGTGWETGLGAGSSRQGGTDFWVRFYIKYSPSAVLVRTTGTNFWVKIIDKDIDGQYQDFEMCMKTTNLYQNNLAYRKHLISRRVPIVPPIPKISIKNPVYGR